MITRALLLLPFLAMLTGCLGHTQTYEISVKNELSEPVTLWLVKDNGPEESGWYTPEQVAETNPPSDDHLPDVVVQPNQTASIGPISGSFDNNPRASLRVYGGTPTLTRMLATGRGGLTRLDEPIEPGRTHLVLKETITGGIGAVHAPTSQPLNASH